MKKPVQSEAKREIVPQEQHESQDQVELQASQASHMPELPLSPLVPDASETSQEVQDTEVPQHGSDPEEAASSQDVSAPQATRTRKRKRRLEAVSEEEITPRPSYWPLALAVALVFLLLGTISHPIVMAVGAILVIGCIIGWSIERR
jgi:hypothetical protein